VHGGAKRSQVTHDGVPITPFQTTTKKYEKKAKTEQKRKGTKRVMKTNPIPRVPPLTRAVIPFRHHLPPLLRMLSSNSAIFTAFHPQ